ncbi:MAG: GNAT family N-acetyltransferase, partial [Saprospiraceae bacterium]
LNSINFDFIPPLSDFMPIIDYVEKIWANATILLAQDNHSIIGISAFYCNDNKYLEGYWTVMGISKKHRGIGIGKELILKMIEINKNEKMKLIKMETSMENKVLIDLVTFFGFRIQSFGTSRKDGSTPVYLKIYL